MRNALALPACLVLALFASCHGPAEVSWGQSPEASGLIASDRARAPGGSSGRTLYDDSQAADTVAPELSLGYVEGGEFAPARPAEPAKPAEPVALARKMIYSARYRVMVAAVDEAIDTLLAETDRSGGYLAERQDTPLVLRIPAAAFRDFLATVAALGRVLEESMQANDVTDAYTDLAIRLENAEHTRTRLLALLEKAEETKDTLLIEEHLRRLTGEIEQMKGRLRLLENQIAFSTVRVRLEGNAPAEKPVPEKSRSRFRWINALGIAQDLERF
jgi:hypothetical protein